MKIKYELYDSFPTKVEAQRFAKELRNDGYRACVRKGDFGLRAGRRLIYGVYIGGFRK